MTAKWVRGGGRKARRPAGTGDQGDRPSERSRKGNREDAWCRLPGKAIRQPRCRGGCSPSATETWCPRQGAAPHAASGPLTIQPCSSTSPPVPGRRPHRRLPVCLKSLRALRNHRNECTDSRSVQVTEYLSALAQSSNPPGVPITRCDPSGRSTLRNHMEGERCNPPAPRPAPLLQEPACTTCIDPASH
jgi:hypothetical protein